MSMNYMIGLLSKGFNNMKKITAVFLCLVSTVAMGCASLPQYIFLDDSASVLDSDIGTLNFVIDYAFKKEKIDIDSITAITDSGEEISADFVEGVGLGLGKMNVGYTPVRLNCHIRSEQIDTSKDTYIDRVRLVSGDDVWEIDTKERILFLKGEDKKKGDSLYISAGIFHVNSLNDFSGFEMKVAFRAKEKLQVEAFETSGLYTVSDMQFKINDAEPDAEDAEFPITLKEGDKFVIVYKGALDEKVKDSDVYCNFRLLYSADGVSYKIPQSLMINRLINEERWTDRINERLENRDTK